MKQSKLLNLKQQILLHIHLNNNTYESVSRLAFDMDITYCHLIKQLNIMKSIKLLSISHKLRCNKIRLSPNGVKISKSIKSINKVITNVRVI